MAFAETLSIQRFLNELGQTPRLVEDGVWGPKTEAATAALYEKQYTMTEKEKLALAGFGVFTLGLILYSRRKCGSATDTARIAMMQPAAAAAAQRVLCELKKKGIAVMVTETLRTNARQAQLYAEGLYTQAPAGRSYHNYGLALDIVPLDKNGNPTWTGVPNSVWLAIGEAGEKHGFQWGGRWKSFPDSPHLQFTSDGSSAELDRLQRAYPDGYKP